MLNPFPTVMYFMNHTTGGVGAFYLFFYKPPLKVICFVFVLLTHRGPRVYLGKVKKSLVSLSLLSALNLRFFKRG